MSSASDDDTLWDIERDLSFLIATDDQLQAELKQVCDLLGSSGSSGDSDDTEAAAEDKGHSRKRKPNVAPAGARNTYQTRQKQEMLELQRQVHALKQQLDATKLQVALQRDLGEWETAARVELYAKKKALEENELLRESTHHNSLFITKMQSLLRKKPRLTMAYDPSSEEWQAYKLAAHASLRIAGIQAIADRQYSRLQTSFINAGIWDRQDNLFCVRPRRDATSVYIEVVHHLKLEAPFHLFGPVVWQLMNGEHPAPLPLGAQRAIENVDADTAYEMYDETTHGFTGHCNTIFKQYAEATRHVVLWRTVLDDALVSCPGDVEDESAWIVFKADRTNPNQCYMTFLLHAAADPSLFAEVATAPGGAPPSPTIDDVLECLAKLSVEAMPDGLGMHPTPERDVVFDGLPLSLTTFIRKGKRFERHLASAINATVKEFHHQNK
ncbi:Aste57867_14626 [Aphanomyces stellatus]|uniref:Aste57867_14626 protein n=1 Tax=Aphanomyces stellatus TaxID=120398 RepID=A0A485L256_9STRA|nr:hypothetical protein As57867_014571 [Aphanomyces stellatus]VFT91445.1 Aste57867_14626 [Aphanomyces stellatus]